jgi:hypothetical protein
VTSKRGFESVLDRLSILQRLHDANIERDERQLSDRKRDVRFLAELVAEGRQELHELLPEELPPPRPGRRGLEQSDPDKFLRIVSDVRRPGWTDHAIAKRYSVDPKTVKRIREQHGVGKNVGKNP